jgi:hypothetical protein
MGEVKKREIALLDIAIVKGWNFSMEYDTCSGREKEREGHHYLKEGFIEGFLAGFAYKFEQSDREVE